LPLDVLQIIFTFIRKSEKKKLKAIGNLHSCLLVNRQWCEATIPLLWCNSFYYFEKGNEKLIDVYISCFNEKE
ncbi:5571_t:CDS:1, partial [Entrophospora sp. SA101]